MRLFVIGNGFDLAHGMNTKYCDFRNYLDNQEPNFLVNFEMAYGFGPIDETDPYTQTGYVEKRKNILWWDFEYNLSNIDADHIVDNVVGMDLGLEMGNIGVLDTMNDHLENEYAYIKKLNEYLLDWVTTVIIPPNKKSNLIDEKTDDVYLTFNYTSVLEELYAIDDYNVMHVHGSIIEDDIEPIIGHGNKNLIEEAKQYAADACDCFDEMAESAYTAVANYYKNTLKDVDFYLFSSSHFFNRLVNIEEVHIIGHSLGEVDMPYFKKIYKVVDQNTKWIVYYHEATDENIFKTKIHNLGVPKNRIIMKHSSEFYR